MFEDEWHKWASCKDHDPEDWAAPTLPVGGHIEPEKTVVMRKAQLICEDCPVRLECLESANEDDLAYTMRGGLWPTSSHEPKVYIGSGFCPNGHDKSIVGVRSKYRGRSECARCARDKSTGPTGPTRPLTDAQLATGLCWQGHNIDPPGSLTASLRCVDCSHTLAGRKTKKEMWQDYTRRRAEARWAVVESA